ncbi:hypothetical protein [Nocardia sp. NPDC004711]
MIAWLAADPAQTNVAASWKDFLTLATPTGTIVGAVIAGYFLLRNARKSPYDRLDLLLKARAAWPQGLEGQQALDRAIQRAVASIRVKEGDILPPFSTEEERVAVAREEQRLDRQSALATLAVGLLLAGLLMAVTLSSGATLEHAYSLSLGVVVGTLIWLGATRLVRSIKMALLRRTHPDTDGDGGGTGAVFDY